MNVSVNTSKDQFITSFEARALYPRGGDLSGLPLLSVQHRVP